MYCNISRKNHLSSSYIISKSCLHKIYWNTFTTKHRYSQILLNEWFEDVFIGQIEMFTTNEIYSRTNSNPATHTLLPSSSIRKSAEIKFSVFAASYDHTSIAYYSALLWILWLPAPSCLEVTNSSYASVIWICALNNKLINILLWISDTNDHVSEHKCAGQGIDPATPKWVSRFILVNKFLNIDLIYMWLFILQ